MRIPEDYELHSGLRPQDITELDHIVRVGRRGALLVLQSVRADCAMKCHFARQRDSEDVANALLGVVERIDEMIEELKP